MLVSAGRVLSYGVRDSGARISDVVTKGGPGTLAGGTAMPKSGLDAAVQFAVEG